MKDNAVSDTHGRTWRGADGQQEESRSGGNGGRDVAKLRRMRLKALSAGAGGRGGTDGGGGDAGGRLPHPGPCRGDGTDHGSHETMRCTGFWVHGMAPMLARLKERVSALEGQRE